MPRASSLSPGAVAMLRERQFAHMVTLMPDGAPQATVVWIDVEPDGGHVLVNSSENRLKTRNLRRDPRVSVSVLDPQDSHRFVILRGQVVELRKEGAPEHYRALSVRYSGREPDRTDLEDRRILRIKPDHVVERGV